MTPSLRPRAIRCVLAGLTSGALLLTACGNDSGGYTDKTADQRLADTVDTTLGLQSFAIDSRLQWTVGSGLQLAPPTEVVLTITGATDYAGMISDTEMTVTRNGSGTAGQVRSDGSNLWIRITGDQAPELLPAGLEWVEGDAGRLNDLENFRISPVGVLSPVILLKGSDGAVEVGGEGNLTKFMTTVDYEAAVAAAGPLAADLQRGFRVPEREPVVLNIHVWLDDDGVVRKMEFTHDSDVDPTYTLTYTLNLNAVNEPVKAPEPPDESTVFSGPEANALLDQILRAQ